MRTFLHKAGYTDVQVAQSAAEAFQFLAMDTPEKHIDMDLILMDIVMPEKNGIEACETIKEDSRYKDTPIIMVTANQDMASLEQAFSAGATDYITRPLQKVELLARVRSALMLKDEMERRKAREKELLDITKQLEEANARLKELASVDGLTGIGNRRYFEEMYEQEWRRAQREMSSLAVLMVDIDFFKRYNDNYGHQQGDECLKKVAAGIRDVLRRPADFLARYGGEEFVVVLPQTNMRGAKHMARTIKETIERMALPHKTSPINPYVTVSVGVAVGIPETIEMKKETLLQAADQALYQAKKSGRNQYKIEALLAEERE